MSIRQENNGNYMGDPSKIEANHGTNAPTKSGAFSASGISGMPALKSDNYPKQGRIAFGKDKLDVVP